MPSINKLPIEKIWFLDIETVPETYQFNDLPVEKQNLFAEKMRFYLEKEENTLEEMYTKRAGILAEFGKIICISIGRIIDKNTFKVKSIYGDDENKILQEFNQLIASSYKKTLLFFCAHNGKEFDFPYITRRMIIHQIPLPFILQHHGKKPWEVPHLDTMELWRFGDYKHYTSLDLLAHILNVPSPKSDIKGADVARVYYEEKDLERIKSYCERDCFTVAQIIRKFRNEPLLDLEHKG